MYDDRISMEMPNLCFKGSHVEMSKLWWISAMNCFYLCKQCRPLWNATLCGISSGSSLFAKVLFAAKGLREHSGSVVECLTQDRGAAGSSLTGVTALCPWARHFNPSLALVQPRKTPPYITERLLIRRAESNQTNKQKRVNHCHVVYFCYCYTPHFFFYFLSSYSIYFQSERKTVWNLIRWLHQKPVDLDLQFSSNW